MITPIDYPDPYAKKFGIKCRRVATDEYGNFYVYMWNWEGSGWVKASSKRRLNELLAEKPYKGVGR